MPKRKPTPEERFIQATREIGVAQAAKLLNFLSLMVGEELPKKAARKVSGANKEP